MAKRIVSGIFLLTALGALGVILAGALTSGEQLIVRFLTAVTVAALGLYVISDLRLQNESADMTASGRPATRSDAPSPTTTVGYMATVTGPQARVSTVPDALGTAAPKSTFEALEPVTGVPSPPPIPDHAGPAIPPLVPVANQDAAHPGPGPLELTNSRLIEPPQSSPLRSVPPHPNTALSRPVQPSEAPTEPILGSHDDTAPLPKIDALGLETVDTGLGRTDLADQSVGAGLVGDGHENPPSLDGPGYLGPLQAADVVWPPPSADEVDHDDELMVLSPLADTAPTPIVFEVDSDIDIEGDNGLVEEFEVDEEFGPVTVDELLSQLDHDHSTPRMSMEDARLLNSETDGDETVAPDAIQADISDQADPPSRPHLTLITSATVSRRIEAAEYVDPVRAELIDLRPQPPEEPAPDDVQASTGSEQIDAGADFDDERLDTAIRSGEIQVISTLIQQGMLTTDGPITDRDVRTMVYVAFTSNELRKLIKSGGTPDLVRAGDVDLGPVELFDESRYAPLPQRVYDPTTNSLDPAPALAGGAHSGRNVVPPMPPASDMLPPKNAAIDLSADGGDAGSDHSSDPAEGASTALPPMPTPKHVYRKSGIDAVAES